MPNTVVKYSIIFLFLLVYINRGFFIFTYEIENHGNKEINSLVEWIVEIITGASNDIDEDGDEQTDYSFTPIILYNFPLQLIQIDAFSKDIRKIEFPYKEKFLLTDFFTQIDHPPQV